MMRWIVIGRCGSKPGVLLLGVVLAVGIAGLGQAAPVAQQDAANAGSLGSKQVQAQLKDVDGKLAGERAHNAKLQEQVAQMEQQNADRAKRLQQRDDQIAALQKKLQAAGVPASTASAGP